MIIRISRVGALALLFGLAFAHAETPADAVASAGQCNWTHTLARISNTARAIGSTSEIIGQLGVRHGSPPRSTQAVFAPSGAAVKLSQVDSVRTSALRTELVDLSQVHPARAPPLQRT